MGQELWHQSVGQRRFAVVLGTGATAVQCRNWFALAKQIRAAQLTTIGQDSDALLNQLEVEVVSPLVEMVEVASAVPDLHVHGVLSGRHGAVRPSRSPGAHMSSTLGVIVTKSRADLRRKKVAACALALTRLGA